MTYHIRRSYCCLLISQLHLLLLLIVQTNAQVEDSVVFYGRSYSKSFSEDSTLGITIKLNENEVTNEKLSQNGFWYVTDASNGDKTIKILTNDNITAETPSTFEVTVIYSMKSLETLTYRVVDVAATSDFVLPNDPEVLSFSLMCRFNASGLVSSSQQIMDMFWSFGSQNDHIDSFETNQNQVEVNKERHLTTLSVKRKKSEVKYRVPEPLSAYSGVYTCHVLISDTEVSNQLIKAVYEIQVFSKPHIVLIPPESQVLSSEAAELISVIHGYPLPNITWEFSPLKQGEVQSTAPGYNVITSETSRRITTESFVGRDKVNSLLRSKLLVMNAHHEFDRGIYKCSAYNFYGSVETSYYLRIRYKYAFIYPMIGLIVEVLVVALIILVSKKMKEHTMKAAAGDNVTINCHSDEGGKPHAGSQAGSAHIVTDKRASEMRKTSNPHTPPLSVVDVERHTTGAHSDHNEDKEYHPHELSKAIVEDPLSEDEIPPTLMQDSRSKDEAMPVERLSVNEKAIISPAVDLSKEKTE